MDMWECGQRSVSERLLDMAHNVLVMSVQAKVVVHRIMVLQRYRAASPFFVKLRELILLNGTP